MITRGAMAKQIVYRHRQLSDKPFQLHAIHPTLADYFAGDANFNHAPIVAKNEAMKPELKRGIALIGSKGVGKSTALRCCSQLPNHLGVYLHNGYTHYLDAPDFAIRYAVDGLDVFDYWKNKPVLFIDDVGNEPQDVKFFGSKISVVAQLLRHRYERKLVTHITANKGLRELETIYDAYIIDRMLDQFNFFLWNGESKRGT